MRWTAGMVSTERVKMSNRLVSEEVLDEAVDWMVILSSGEVRLDQRREFEQWLGRGPQHAQAWAVVQGAMNEPLQALQTTQAEVSSEIQQQGFERVILRPRTRRNFLAKTLALAGIGLSTAAFSHRHFPLTSWRADYATATAERLTTRLADGSLLRLNARSAANFSLQSLYRQLTLQRGEVQVDVAASNTPFVLTSNEGRVQSSLESSSKASFLVQQLSGASRVSALTDGVEVQLSAGQRLHLERGESVLFNASELLQRQSDQAFRTEWQAGMHIAHNESLSDLMAAFKPYYHGFIRVAPEAADLSVYGGYPLDDIDQVFDSLAQTLPLRITRLSPWLTHIDLA